MQNGEPESEAASAWNVTVWYDGDCPLCLREIRLMRRLDRKQAIRFLDVHEGRDCPLAPERLLERFHAQEQDGPLLSGAAAFAAMWRAIPLLRPLGLAARWQPLQAVLERLYLLFLRARPTLQRWAGA
jgi:predicted DCC family thiol-disulfide oxidoreductase YuxK